MSLTVNPSVSSVSVVRCHSVRWLSGPYESLSSSTIILRKNDENLVLTFSSGLELVYRGGEGIGKGIGDGGEG